MSFWSGLLTKVVESAAESGVVKEASSALLEGVARTVRRMAFESVTPAELGLALLAARLCELTYDTNTSEALSAGLASLLPQSELVWFQPQLEHHVTAQWYMARAQLPPGVDDGGPALFVVFRGTQSFNDVANNLQALPAAGPNGGEFHAGFLRATRDDATLGRLLREHVPRTPRVYLMGHSLGGALALTLWGAQLLPPAAGRVTVVTLGSPAVFHGAAQLTPAQQRARVLSVVNAADAVPRLLGSPMKLTKGVLGACVDTSGGKARDTARMLQTLEEYTQPPQLELLYLSERGGAQRVPPSGRDAVLHLARRDCRLGRPCRGAAPPLWLSWPHRSSRPPLAGGSRRLRAARRTPDEPPSQRAFSERPCARLQRAGPTRRRARRRLGAGRRPLGQHGARPPRVHARARAARRRRTRSRTCPPRRPLCPPRRAWRPPRRLKRRPAGRHVCPPRRAWRPPRRLKRRPAGRLTRPAAAAATAPGPTPRLRRPSKPCGAAPRPRGKAAVAAHDTWGARGPPEPAPPRVRLRVPSTGCHCCRPGAPPWAPPPSASARPPPAAAAAVAAPAAAAPAAAAPAVAAPVVQGLPVEGEWLPATPPCAPDVRDMRLGAIRAELHARGVATAGLLEKEEYVQALLLARQAGIGEAETVPVGLPVGPR